MSDDHWHRPLFQIRAGEAKPGDTMQTSGMTQAGRRCRARASAPTSSGWGQTHVAAER